MSPTHDSRSRSSRRGPGSVSLRRKTVRLAPDRRHRQVHDVPPDAAALEASAAEIVTVAVRRVNLTDRTKESLLDYIPRGMTLLPNTAGCYTRRRRRAHGAPRPRGRVCRSGSSSRSSETNRRSGRTTRSSSQATRTLVAEGFVVFPYTSDDPIVAPKARGRRSGRRDAARRADRLRPRDPESEQHLDHPRARRSSRDRRRRRRHGVRRVRGHGARSGRRPHEHGYRRSATTPSSWPAPCATRCAPDERPSWPAGSPGSATRPPLPPWKEESGQRPVFNPGSLVLCP